MAACLRQMRNKKTAKMLVISCLFAALLFLLAISVYAGEETVRITFTNARTDSTSLYITKKVESAVAGYNAPEDDEFTFVVKLEDKVVKEQEYHLLAKTGKELFNYDGVITTTQDSTKIPIPFKTDRSGRLSLKADQTARFDGLRAGMSYEVTELEKENYEQTSPAGGVPAIGTITQEGSAVSFVNTYSTTTTPTLPETTLKIRKNVAFPAGYTPPETPEFNFKVKIKNKPWANERYVLMDAATKKQTGAGETDGEGLFKMKAGLIAVFSEVPVDADYEVTEESLQGWRLVGKTGDEGVTKTPETSVSFTNSESSFAVSKRTNNASTQDFSFTLKKEDSTGYADVSYYLYDIKGNRLDNQTYKTTSEGKFTLKSGQVAMFVGVAPGTKYSVTETPAAGYHQLTPPDPLGYVDKVVRESVEVLPFVNDELPPDVSSLSVTKTVSYGLPMAAKNETFTFVLSEKTDGGNVPVAGAVYEIKTGESSSTFSTDANGKFTLKENQTAKFESLFKNKVYLVEEVDIPQRYSLENTEEQSGKPADNPTFVFNNAYGKAALTLTKVSALDQTILLEEAEFGIYTDQDCQNEIGTMVTKADGKAESEFLYPGNYFVKEKKAPDKYELNTTVYPVTIDGTVGKVPVTTDPITDMPMVGMVKLLKVDAANRNKVLEGATFGIYSDEKCEKEVSSLVTDNSGVAVSEQLPLNTYYIKEKIAPIGYKLSEAVHKVELKTSGATVDIGTLTNEHFPISIKVIKYDSNGTTPLAGVEFTLKAPDGTTAQKTTNNAGEIVFDKLGLGKYEITETKTLPGRSLLTGKIKVDIPLVMTEKEAADANANTANAYHDVAGKKYYFYDLTYHVTNSVSLDMPTSGAGGNPSWAIVIGSVFMALGFIVLFRKKNKS